VLLVLLDNKALEPREMWEAAHADVAKPLAVPCSKARWRRALGIAELQRLARRIWPRCEMSFSSEAYRVLIASPSDLLEERQAATDASNEWNAQHAAAEGIVLLPVKRETHAVPEIAGHPQGAINR
jgi:hypothetical protein